MKIRNNYTIKYEILETPKKDVFSSKIINNYKSDKKPNKEIIELLLKEEKNNGIINKILI